MRKFGKFLLSMFSLAAIGAGAYYVYKNLIENNYDDFDEFDEMDVFDDLDDIDNEDEDKREYVSINLTPNPEKIDTSAKSEKPSEDLIETNSTELDEEVEVEEKKEVK